VTPLQPAKVVVPCSTSNLGAGFDCIGLALDRHLTATFRPSTRGGLTLSRTGTLAYIGSPMKKDLTLRVFRERVGRTMDQPSGELEVTSTIPIGKGLGASAAAVLTGFALAETALGLEVNKQEAFRYALELEGHGDNAAPSLWGGLVAVVPGRGDNEPPGQGLESGMRASLSGGTVWAPRSRTTPLVAGLDLSDKVGFAFASPSHTLSTPDARRTLPSSVPYEVAARSLARSAALVAGLATANPDLLRIAVEDELHVPFRIDRIAGGREAMRRGYEAKAWAVTISGAGSGLIAMCEPELADGIAEAMKEAFLEASPGGGPPPETHDLDERDREHFRKTGDPGETECVGFSVRPQKKGLVVNHNR